MRSLLLALVLLGFVGCNEVAQHDPAIVVIDGDSQEMRCWVAATGRPVLIYCER